MTYVMAYVAPVPRDRREQYREHSERAAAIFKEHGATRVVECWADDLPAGTLTSFPLSVKAEANESVAMGWQEWPDKATHDANIEKAMQDPRLREMGEMPFDGKRLIYGGFETLLDI